MNFILVDKTTVSLLSQERRLQLTEFDEGLALAQLLGGNVQDASPIYKLHTIYQNDGLFLLSSQPDTSHCLVFDQEMCDGFRTMKPEGSLLVFQRAIRFAIKIWNQLNFTSSSEHVVSGKYGRKFILFPFPVGTSSQYRLTLDSVTRETHPDERHLLAYRWGKTEGGGADETPSRSRLFSALSALETVVTHISSLPVEDSTASDKSVLEVTELDKQRMAAVPMVMPFDNWLPLLTDVQRRFVTRELSGPERLEGPAGTGKTLTLMLKCINGLRIAARREEEHRSIFLTHSKATKRAIQERMEILDSSDQFWDRHRLDSPQSLTITTLQEWCGAQIGTGLPEAEYLDRDASQSKEVQLLYVLEALEEALGADLKTHRPFMSKEFISYLEQEDRWRIAEMTQHEIAVVIKGRAREDLDLYRELPPIKYNLPLQSAGDRGFVYLVYRGYQRRLESTSQFDTDDIVLSAMRQFDTPIWRRRRELEGFNSIYVDETHLFNLNELSIIHFLPRKLKTVPIAFAVDRSQAIGDRGINNTVIQSSLLADSNEEVNAVQVRSIFRSSPEIINLALSVTTGAATLFTNFENPLELAGSAFTTEDEKLSKTPSFILVPTDENLLDTALREADAMANRLRGGRSSVAIVVFDPELFALFKRVVRERNRPVEILDRRGDLEVVDRAQATGRFILAAPEYVGGLEFNGVILAGVDEGRVPRTSGNITGEGKHFVRYAAHNLLYVAITRAKYEVLILGNSERGLSDILTPARDKGLLVASD